MLATLPQFAVARRTPALPLPGLALPAPGSPTVRIGRGPGATLRLADVSVSRCHAELRHVDDGWMVRDLGSMNGTEVNGLAHHHAGPGPSRRPHPVRRGRLRAHLDRSAVGLASGTWVRVYRRSMDTDWSPPGPLLHPADRGAAAPAWPSSTSCSPTISAAPTASTRTPSTSSSPPTPARQPTDLTARENECCSFFTFDLHRGTGRPHPPPDRRRRPRTIAVLDGLSERLPR